MLHMTKETILAIIAGLSIGVLAAWGVWNLTLKKTENPTLPGILRTESPIPDKTTEFELILNEPPNESFQTAQAASVSGKTVQAATVVISTATDEEVLTASSDGSFSTEIILEEGQNEISVTAFTQSGEEKTETKTINYTSEEF